MVLLSEMDQSDDDNSFELVGSEDLHTDKSDHTDSESFEIIGSEELNSAMKDMEEVDHAGSMSEENDTGILDMDGGGNSSQSDEQQLENVNRYSDKSEDSKQRFSEGSTYPWGALPINGLDDKDEQLLDDLDRYSEQSFSDGSTYSWDALPINELDHKYKGSRCRDVVFDMDGTAYVCRPNIKLRKDMEIKDVAKDHVMPFLPAKSLARFRTVSKEWDNWISHPFLAHRQTLCFQDMSGFFCQDGFNHFFVSLDQAAYGIPDSSLSFLPWTVKIRNSCNGLLLCQGVGDESVNEYYICNPANRGFHVLPRSTYYHGPEPNLILAFEPSPLNCGEDYKVICAFDIYNGPPMLCFDIYSSETRSWTCCNAVCSELGAPYLKDNGLYKNGVAYWATSTGELLAFDTVNDICGVQPICSDVKDGGGILTLIDGDLFYVQTSMQTEIDMFSDEEGVKSKCIIEIFGGVNMSLKRRDVVGLDMEIYNAWSFRVLFAVKSNIFIFNINDILYSCDVKKEKFEVIRRGRIKPNTTYIPYVNSLVPLP
ncbi:hypothetical protein POM88_050822 [Heracleum sosnowskyi]|uniref:F-box associated beta-propeller type 1 domain-containing protein n=1 Tax=Heracleum sosnowskyi TaxID=360622 RepID=A0AAD8H101_9APIA|nr:hypothetical protein POM88_050822 [Heracleum sosnowskyi]